MKTLNFRPCGLDPLILPPDMREWLPEGHLANFIIDAAAGLDLSAIVTSWAASPWTAPRCAPTQGGTGSNFDEIDAIFLIYTAYICRVKLLRSKSQYTGRLLG